MRPVGSMMAQRHELMEAAGMADEAKTMADAAGNDGPTRLLTQPPKVINVGLERFADDLARQGCTVQHVQWSPPAGGDAAGWLRRLLVEDRQQPMPRRSGACWRAIRCWSTWCRRARRSAGSASATSCMRGRRSAGSACAGRCAAPSPASPCSRAGRRTWAMPRPRRPAARSGSSPITATTPSGR